MAEGLLDHLVGSGKQRWRRGEAERLGRLEAMTTSSGRRLTAWVVGTPCGIKRSLFWALLVLPRSTAFVLVNVWFDALGVRLS